MAILNDPIADKTARLKAKLAKQAQLARQIPGVPSGGDLKAAPGINQFTPNTLNSARQNLGPNAPIKLAPVGQTVTPTGTLPNPDAPTPLPKGAMLGDDGKLRPATREEQIRQRAKDVQVERQGYGFEKPATTLSGDPIPLEIRSSTSIVEDAPDVLPSSVDAEGRIIQPNRADLATGAERADPLVRQKIIVDGHAVDKNVYHAQKRAEFEAKAAAQIKNAGGATRDAAGNIYDKFKNVVGKLTAEILNGEAAYKVAEVGAENVEGARQGAEAGVENRQQFESEQFRTDADMEAELARQDAEIDRAANGNRADPDLSDADRVQVEPEGPPRPTDADVPPAAAADGKPKSERNIFQRTLDSVINKGKGLGEAFSKGRTTTADLDAMAKKPDGKIKGGLKGLGTAGLIELGTNLIQTIIEDQENAPELIAEQTGLAVQHIAGRIQRGEYIELAQEAAIGTADIPARLLSGGITIGAELTALNGQVYGEIVNAFGGDAGIFGPSPITGDRANFGKSIGEISEPDYIGPNPEGLSGRLNAIANSFEQGSLANIDQVLPTLTGNPNSVGDGRVRFVGESDQPQQTLNDAVSNTGTGGGSGEIPATVQGDRPPNTFISNDPNSRGGQGVVQNIDELPNEQRDINESGAQGLRAANNEFFDRPSVGRDFGTGESAAGNFAGAVSLAKSNTAQSLFDQNERDIGATERAANLRTAGLRGNATIEADAKEADRIYDMLGSDDEDTRNRGRDTAINKLLSGLNNGTVDYNNQTTQVAQQLLADELFKADSTGLFRGLYNSIAPEYFGGNGKQLSAFLSGDSAINAQNIGMSAVINQDGRIIIKSTDPQVNGIDLGKDFSPHVMSFFKEKLRKVTTE
jgi:hypothetical protein